MTTPSNKVPLGKPLELSDDDLERLSQVTPADIEAAKQFWRKYAPEEFINLLDTVEVVE